MMETFLKDFGVFGVAEVSLQTTNKVAQATKIPKISHKSPNMSNSNLPIAYYIYYNNVCIEISTSQYSQLVFNAHKDTQDNADIILDIIYRYPGIPINVSLQLAAL